MAPTGLPPVLIKALAGTHLPSVVLTALGGGGRTWWAHFEITRINIALTILKNQIEDLMNVKGIGEKNFLKLKPRLTVSAPKA